MSSKLSLPRTPPEHALRQTWLFRRSDLDQFDHVNNAANWAVVEEVLQSDELPRRGFGEIEYLAPADADDLGELMVDHEMMWVVAHGRTLTAARWKPLD